MFRLRPFMMMVSVVFAICAFGSASAFAHEYLVNGAAITGSTSLPVLTIGGLAILEAAPTKIIDCEKSHGLILILAGGRSFVHDIHFLNCKTTETGCSPHSIGAENGLILLENIPDLLVGRKQAGGTEVVADEFKENPTTKEFITLKFLGTCTSYPETKVTGQVAGETTGELTLFPTPELQGNSLVSFGKASKFLAHFKNTLVGGGNLTVD